MADPKITRAKAVITSAQKKAKALLSDESKNRSTRTRAAYKVKADALDKVQEVLAK